MLRILIALLLLVPATAFSFQNEPSGFRNIPWSSPINKIAGLRPAGEPSDTVKRYMKMDETLIHAGMELNDVLYVAEGDKFVGAELTYNCAQYARMAEGLNVRYGAPATPAAAGKPLMWQGKITTVTLGALPGKQTAAAEPALCSLSFFSTPHILKQSGK